MFDLHWEDPKPLVGVEVCWSGDHAEGEQWLKPLRAFGKPAVNELGPMPYVQIQSKDDAMFPRGGHYYLKNGFVTKLADDGIDLILDVFQRTPGQYGLFADHCGGAYRRVALDATAFPRRDMDFVLAIYNGWQNPSESDEKIANDAHGLAGTRAADQRFLYELRGSGYQARRLSGQLRAQSRVGWSRSSRSTTR